MLRLENIKKTFNPGTVNEKCALQGLSLHLKPGDFATIIGSNGAGKSTMMNAIAGVFYVDEGSVILGGKDITFTPEYKRSRVIGRLFQDPLKGTAPHMTIEENLALAFLRASGHTSPFSRITKKDRDLFAEKLSELGLGLEDRMKQPVGLLSGGQRQALTLLMATMVPPKLLLLDEHTAALDPGAAEKVLGLTRDIVAEHKLTTMMITHNIRSALELGNRTIMMDAGRIVFDVQGEERSRMTVDDLLEALRDALDGKVKEVRLSARLADAPAGLTSEGPLSLEMEKVLSAMPLGGETKAERILELNPDHPVFDALKRAMQAGGEDLAVYSKLVYNQALLAAGLKIDNPVEFTDCITKILTK